MLQSHFAIRHSVSLRWRTPLIAPLLATCLGGTGPLCSAEGVCLALPSTAESSFKRSEWESCAVKIFPATLALLLVTGLVFVPLRARQKAHHCKPRLCGDQWQLRSALGWLRSRLIHKIRRGFKNGLHPGEPGDDVSAHRGRDPTLSGRRGGLDPTRLRWRRWYLCRDPI